MYDNSGTQKIVRILESLVGQSGWWRICNLSIHSFERDDHILMVGFTDMGNSLDHEQWLRLFSLLADVQTDAGYLG